MAFFLKGNKNFRIAAKIRVGQVTGNAHIFIYALESFSFGTHSKQQGEEALSHSLTATKLQITTNMHG